ncbi:hypothetical protein OIN60_08090 [Paenibacillus sp. P96]|uniref:DNA-binding protein n=1 Tax=Paenibacillus zeirhizosphaerae TaxID=2987519 RepID=A0ABT9FPS2_9BACL|nr:hypothetical protein [Paenibacillus sp. P96]MDP4096730.1 hypothetical protein [Paenibacillus sp. P96]
MDSRYDTFLVAAIGAVLAIWALYAFRSWLREPEHPRLYAIPLNEEIEEGPASAILEENGYEVIGGRLRVPLAFDVNGETIQSRLYIDYIAEQDRGIYIVKTSRRRKPMEWSGSEIRDKFLPLLLLYPEVVGVLYVDTEERTVRRIVLTADEWNHD